MNRGPSRRSRVFVKAARTPERMLLNRVLLILLLLTLALAVFWFDRDGLRDQIDGHISFIDVVYFTAVTVTTVGYGDIVPVDDRARLVDALFVTPLRLTIWVIFLGTAYELVLQRWLEERRMKRLQDTLRGHLIICGFGHSGQTAAREAVARGRPAAQVLILDRDEAHLRQAAELGYVGLRGDATRDQTLREAGVERAEAVLVCVGRDDTATLAVLTVRQISASVRLVCNVEEEENIKLIRQAGADAVIAPAIFGGYLMAGSVRSTHAADYVDDLIRSDGRVYLRERPARSEEIGRAVRELGPGLVVRLYRGSEVIGFWERERATVAAGDMLLEILPTALADRAADS